MQNTTEQSSTSTPAENPLALLELPRGMRERKQRHRRRGAGLLMAAVTLAVTCSLASMVPDIAERVLRVLESPR